MKRLLILIGILAAFSASAQINRIEYFWDTDPGFGSGIALPIASGSDTVGNVFSFSTVGLQPGVHTVYVRTRDTGGRWSVASKKAIRIEEAVFPIAKAEYFFDTDPGFGNGIDLLVTPADSVELLANAIPTNSLTPGLHTLYIRTRDSNHKWSIFSKRVVHIQQPTYPIVQAEYFYDTDPGFGNGIPITISTGDSIDLAPAALGTGSLSPGIHTAYIRVKSFNGEWSVFSKRLVHIQYPEAPEILAAEYFVDTDPGFGNGTAIALTYEDDSVHANFQMPTDTLSLGIHMVHVRVKYSNDQWSTFSKKLVYIDNPADDPVVAAEYFIDADPGIGNGTPITINPGDSTVANFSAPTDTLLIGPHWIFVRVLDAEGRWSVYSRDSFYVDNFDCLVYGNGEIELLGDTCRGTEITFKDKTTSNSGVNPDDFSYEWDFFNDTVVDFTDSVVSFTFNQTGTYDVTLKVFETANPVCQEIVTKTFTIRRVDTLFNNAQICDGDSILLGGDYQKTADTYYDTYSNKYGCDSVRVTELTVVTNLVPSITISTADTNVCSGFSTLFTSVQQNGGTSYYTWKVNGIMVSEGYGFQGYHQFSSTTLADGDVVTCDLTSSETCVTQSTVTSNSLTMNVTTSVAASITIAVDTNDFCSGTTATFTVTDLENEGSNPQYQWYRNNFPVLSGGNGTTLVSSDIGNEQVRCYLTSDAVCVNNSPVSSNVINMIVTTSGFPDVSISPSTNSVCYGTEITFTAFSSFGGSNPDYQWYLNDSLVQGGAANVYSNDSLDDEDEVKCVLVSDYECRLADTDTSNTVVLDIIYNLPVSVALVPSGNNVCDGTGVTFSAFPTNAGSPNYEFFVNGASVQNGSQYYYNTVPNDDDSIWAVVTSDISCATNNPATSDTIGMTVVEIETVAVSITVTDDSICAGTPVTFTANATNPGVSPTYVWRVNSIQVQASGVDTFTSAGLADGSVVHCELYGDHQCPTPVPAVSNSITMDVTDTLLPSAMVSIPQTTICQGTEVTFTATLSNEGANPVVEWLVDNSVVQTDSLTYTSSTLQDFDVVRVRLTVDYDCPVQNPVLSNPVVMTVIDSVTPAVFVYHGPNPACPGGLISVFTTTSTGGDAPTYQFRVNGNLVQSGINSQYTSAAFNDGDVVQVTMTSNAECIRSTAALSNFDTIRINDLIPADVSIQVITAAQCLGELTMFKATAVNGGTSPIYTWRVNNAVFQSGNDSIFSTAALQNGDSVYCEMASILSCATNNPALSNTVHIQLQSCISCDSIDCSDTDLCTNDTCINGECFNTAFDCSDGDACTTDKCEDGICDHADIVCADSSLCTSDFCDAVDGCIFQPLDCNDHSACTNDFCVDSLGECGHSAVICPADGDSCTIELCDIISGCISVPKDCNDNDPCTSDHCEDNNCQNRPVLCTPLNACFTSACDNGICNQTPVVCDDADICTVNTCDTITGCVFRPVDCADADDCTDDFCDTLGACVHTPIVPCGNPCDTLVCFDVDLCTTDGCDPLTGCTFTPCNDGDPCTTDLCMPTGCVFFNVTGCGGNPCDTLLCFDGNSCTIDGCDSLTGCIFPLISCADDSDICTSDECLNVLGCIHLPIPGCVANPCDTLDCDDGDACTTDDCEDSTCTHVQFLMPVASDDDSFFVYESGLPGGSDTDPDNADAPAVPQPTLVSGNILSNDTITCHSAITQVVSGAIYTPDINGVITVNTGSGTLTLFTQNFGGRSAGDFVYILTSPADHHAGLGNNTLSQLFTYTLTDANGNTDDALLIINVVDDTPEGVSSCYEAILNQPPVAGNVFDNNVQGADGNLQLNQIQLTFPSVPDATTYFVTHPELTGASLSSNSVLIPIPNASITTLLGGTLQISPDGSFFYTPNNLSPDGAVDSLSAMFTDADQDTASEAICFNIVAQDSCASLDCNDNNACTADTCISGQCNNNAINCDDADACTIDSCEALNGCFYTTVDCNDDDACTDDACDGVTGCEYSVHLCDDGNACTLDSCDSQAGCFETPIDCNDNDACTDDSCDPITGCQYSAHHCDDADACTLDSCNAQSGCFYADVTCNDGDVCTDDLCNALVGCVFRPISCNDQDSCTVDKCELGACVNTPMVCNDGDFCTTDSCIGGTCFFLPVVCNDNDVCTDDSCSGFSGCLFTPRDCDDGDDCTNDQCASPSGCFSSPVSCDDGEVCTFDFCANGSCFHDCDTNANHELIWQKALGGTGSDQARGIHQTADGGYIVTGYAYSNNGDASGNHGQSDFWAARLDANGTLLWQKSLGGSKSESANAVRQTADGGYVIAGNVKSNDGDVSGNNGGEDFWVVKLDVAGNLQWQNALGGDNADVANAIEQTTDGGYIVAGWTSSNVGDVSRNHGGSDYWVVKLDPAGNLVWQKTLGGTSSDQAYDVKQTNDGGYIVIGTTKSNNGDVTGNHGASDYWAVKLNSAGNIEWQKALGGSNPESGQSVQQTTDGGYILAGSSKSNNGDVLDNYGGDDFWIVKLDGTGNLSWERNFGGSADDVAKSIAETADNGFFVAGASKSTDGDVTGNHGSDDFWTIHLSETGDLKWQNSFGGNKKDQAYSTQQTADEGFVIAGFTDSHNNGDVTGHHSNSDFWVVKLASSRVCRPVTEILFTICPGDSAFVGSGFVSASGVYYDSLLNNNGCDSTIVYTVTVPDCDDNDPCTVDACANGICTHTPLPCDDGDICTMDDCDAAHNGCFFTPVVCNDNDPCTEDVCHFGACMYEPIICNDNNDCTIDACVNGTCEFTDERRVLSFTLVSATTDTDLGLLADGAVIDLFVTGPISIRADVCATSNIESVKFLVDGSFQIMENIPFYTIAGDNGGNYNPWNVLPGTYTITAIPYSGNNGGGITGIQNEITITIVDNTPPCLGNARKVVDFTLVSAATETDIGTLLDGAVIDLDVTGPINVRANVCLENNIESVRFLLNGSNYVLENIPFYTIAGDNGGNYNTWNVLPGVYTIRAIPYSGNGGTGIVGDYHEVTITIIGGVPPCQQGQNRVFDFTLVDADDDIDIGTLSNGAIIDLSVTGPINVRANVCEENVVESVKFLLNGGLFRTENEAPYLLAGDNFGNYHTWNVQPGVYTIKATPYTGNNGGGTAGVAHEVTITIISGGAPKLSGEELFDNSSAEGMQLSAYPNPFSDQLNIEFTLAESSRVKLEIFNVTGQKVASLFEGDVKSDELQHFEFKPGHLADGVFFYRLQTGEEIYHGKVLMVR